MIKHRLDNQIVLSEGSQILLESVVVQDIHDYISAMSSTKSMRTLKLEIKCQIFLNYPIDLVDKIELYDTPGFKTGTDNLLSHLKNLSVIIKLTEEGTGVSNYVWVNDYQSISLNLEKEILIEMGKRMNFLKNKNTYEEEKQG